MSLSESFVIRMWNGIPLEPQTCLDNFKQVEHTSFSFLFLPPTPILVSVVMFRETRAFFLFDCSQWEVVWDLFVRGGKQSQCLFGGLRKLEKFDVSRSYLKGTYYAY